MTELDFTSSQTWTVPAGVTSVDIFLVGGGAGGNSVSGSFCGGAGGYTATYTGIAVTPAQNIDIVIGAGGVGANGAYGASHEGGYSEFLNSSYRALGGEVVSAKRGGSGGGGFDGSRAGGSDGSDGVGSGSGTGQATTTRKFAEGGNTLYAGGGGGPNTGVGGAGGGGNGGNPAGSAGTANTGGGGGASQGAVAGGAGGSGFVSVRYTPPASTPNSNLLTLGVG